MKAKQSQLHKKEKLTWLTKCPICGKSHTNIWVLLLNQKKKIYQGICSSTKELFDIEIV